MKENKFGDRVKKLRKNKGWSQVYLGSKLVYNGGPVPGKTFGNWELGRREAPHEIIIQLSDIFGVSIDYLMGKDIPAWASSDDIIKLDNFLENDSQIALTYNGEILSKEEKKELKRVLAFYFWEREAKQRGAEILENARK